MLNRLFILLIVIVFVGCSTNQKPIDNSEFKFSSKGFETFYNKFRTDSMFQLDRIKFPIKGKYQDYEESREWTKEDWHLMTWDLRQEMKNPDDSISIVQDSIKFFYGQYCKECGFSFEMQFDNIENQWFLTYRQENNY